jgi:hypothetical protein
MSPVGLKTSMSGSKEQSKKITIYSIAMTLKKLNPQ